MELSRQRWIHRILPALAGLGTIALLGTALVASQGKDAQAAGHQRGGPPPRLKNIKILKNMSPQQVIGIMRVVSASLGVRCDFCHVEGDFASDAKETKRTAREMMLMTNRLNAHEKIIDKRATCYMCHHGHPEPETRSPAGERPPGPGGRGEGGERP